MKAAFGAESAAGVGAPEFEVTHSIPSVPTALDATQPAGRAGTTTPSKFSLKIFVGLPHSGVGVTIGVKVAVGVGEAVAVAVGVAVLVGVGEAVAVAVGVEVAVAVDVDVGDGVGTPPLQKIWTLSILQPWFEMLVSLAMRQRRTVGCPLAAAGRFATVVMKPLELPLQAARPAIGLLN